LKERWMSEKGGEDSSRGLGWRDHAEYCEAEQTCPIKYDRAAATPPQSI